MTIPQYLKTHIFYLSLIAVGLIAGHEWLKEHDARLSAESIVRQSEAREKDIESRLLTLQNQTKIRTEVIRKQVASITTPKQAIAAIPSLSDVPLNLRPSPDMPDAVEVSAIPLAQELGQCREDSINLQSCQQELGMESDLRAECRVQLAAITKKPKFWHRVWGQVKTGSVFLSIGIVVAKVLL